MDIVEQQPSELWRRLNLEQQQVAQFFVSAPWDTGVLPSLVDAQGVNKKTLEELTSKGVIKVNSLLEIAAHFVEENETEYRGLVGRLSPDPAMWEDEGDKQLASLDNREAKFVKLFLSIKQTLESDKERRERMGIAAKYMEEYKTKFQKLVARLPSNPRKWTNDHLEKLGEDEAIFVEGYQVMEQTLQSSEERRERIEIAAKYLEQNEAEYQSLVEGLPANPREWSNDDLEALGEDEAVFVETYQTMGHALQNYRRGAEQPRYRLATSEFHNYVFITSIWEHLNPEQQRVVQTIAAAASWDTGVMLGLVDVQEFNILEKLTHIGVVEVISKLEIAAKYLEQNENKYQSLMENSVQGDEVQRRELKLAVKFLNTNAADYHRLVAGLPLDPRKWTNDHLEKLGEGGTVFVETYQTMIKIVQGDVNIAAKYIGTNAAEYRRLVAGLPSDPLNWSINDLEDLGEEAVVVETYQTMENSVQSYRRSGARYRLATSELHKYIERIALG